ncbi:hypothetical protein NPIL_343851, partial [Nephila pilipes]
DHSVQFVNCCAEAIIPVLERNLHPFWEGKHHLRILYLRARVASSLGPFSTIQRHKDL